MTPPVAGGHGAEIDAWFAQHPAPGAWVIISTAAPESLTDEQRAHLVQVNPAEGLTVDIFRKALDILGVACPSTITPDSGVDPGSGAVKAPSMQQLAREATERASCRRPPPPRPASAPWRSRWPA
jgi:hypothetical protein